MLEIPVVWHCRMAQRDPWLDPILSRSSALIVTNSQATASRFPPQVKEKIRVVHNGVNIRWIQDREIRKPEELNEDWKVILVVARVSKWKRHDLALSAFDQLASLDPTLHLIFIGARDSAEPKWWDYLQNKTKNSPFADRIHWLGQVDDVRPWYRGADMLMLCSVNEPFGRVIIEAMACGLPVIATRDGGVPEIISHGQEGFLVAVDNVEELTQASLTLLQDNSLRRRLGESARKRANCFSLETHLIKMSQVFEEAINKHHSR
jgi:glycosyltransferase involved in cell wall biosynthesis